MRPGTVIRKQGETGIVLREQPDGRLAIVPVVRRGPRGRHDVTIGWRRADSIAVKAFETNSALAAHVLSARVEGQDYIGNVTPELLAEIETAVACAEAERAAGVSIDAMDHLGLVLDILADLSPNDRCRGLDEAQAFYNAARPDARIAPNPGYVTKLVHVGPLDWPAAEMGG